MTKTAIVTCLLCDVVLDEAPELVRRPPCPACGSTFRHVEVELGDARPAPGRLTLIRKTYREDLGEYGEDGSYDFAYLYWVWEFEIDGYEYWAKAYTDEPDQAYVAAAVDRPHLPFWRRRLLREHIGDIADYLRAEGVVHAE